MLSEDDIIFPAQGILDYWCHFKDRSFSQERPLSFIRYEFSRSQEKTYAQGYMSHVSLEARWQIDRKNNLSTFNRRRFTYMPLWILDREKMSYFVQSQQFFHAQYAGPRGYHSRLHQEDAFRGVSVILPNVAALGLTCGSCCSIHPGAYIGQLSKNYIILPDITASKKYTPSTICTTPLYPIALRPIAVT